MPLENIKENIKKLANFIVISKQKSWSIFEFKQLEDELNIQKEEIISIFDLFCKAKLFNYQIIPWGHPEEMKYDFAKTKEIINAETGGFSLIPFDKIEKGKKIIPTDINKFNSFIESPIEIDNFLKEYGHYLKIPIHISENEKTLGQLKINLKTGDFIYYNMKGNLSPNSQEFKILVLLITSENNQSNYNSLFKIIRPQNEIASKSDKFYIYTIIRNIKRKFGILSKNKKQNRDCFKNIKGFGYKLTI